MDIACYDLIISRRTRYSWSTTCHIFMIVWCCRLKQQHV